MQYAQARSVVLQLALDRQIERFVAGYNPSKATVVLLPGGMGSELDCSRSRHHPDRQPPQTGFHTVWIDIGLLLSSDALRLGIRPEDGADRDRRFIVSDGPLWFFSGDTKPYDETEAHLRAQGYNVFVFGYDWRRPVSEAASLLRRFFRVLHARVRERFGGRPTRIAETSLLCHSMGGLVATVFLQQQFRDATRAQVSAWIQSVITVGTPFYGTCNHVYRYYRGQSLLNQLHGLEKIARLSATLPGPFALNFLDRRTYRDVGEKLEIPVERYPMWDTASNADVDPNADAMLALYPKPMRTGKLGAWVKRSLRGVRRERRLLARPWPTAVRPRVFHLRSGLARGVVGLEMDRSAAESFAYGDDPPFTEWIGDTDNTVPYWSARHADTADDHVWSLGQANDHARLLEHEETLQVVDSVLSTGALPSLVRRGRHLVARASRTGMEELVRDAANERLRPNDPRLVNERLMRRIAEEVLLC